MEKQIRFFLIMFLTILAVRLLVIGLKQGDIFCIIVSLFVLLVETTPIYNYMLKKYFYNNRKKYANLTSKELEFIEDANNLIHKVDNSIISPDYEKYKVTAPSPCSWFIHNSSTDESGIFIPFKELLLFGKDFCFMNVLHEVLHAYNLRNGNYLFKLPFLEGLNQYLTLWLIDNYSEKYHIPSWRRNFLLIILSPSYKQEVKLVRKTIEELNLDPREIFINYVTLNEDYFKENIPSQYLND